MSPERAQSLVMQAFKRGTTTPAPSTLRRYGMTAAEWIELLAEQGWVCPICERDAGELKLNTDHEHVRGWEKMTNREKARYTRGILCAHCNHRKVHSKNDAATTGRILHYLER